jgi:hypothetical protein
VIKIESSDFKKIAESIKYFDLDDGSGVIWRCRALPFDKELVGPNKNLTNLKQNVIVKGIPVEKTAE